MIYDEIDQELHIERETEKLLHNLDIVLQRMKCRVDDQWLSRKIYALEKSHPIPYKLRTKYIT